MKKIITIAIFMIAYLSFSLAQIPTDSLVAYYPFNGNANDESGNGNNGTVNGVSFVNVDQGTIAQFASTSYIEVTDNTSFDFSNVPGVTIETWIRLEQATTGYIIQKEGPSGLDDDEYMINVQTSDGQLLGAFTGPSSQHQTISSVNKLALNTWYNVILMWNQTNGNVSFYINGVLDNTVSSSVTSIQNTNVPITIGRSYQGTQRFIGSLDEVRIYKRVLSDSEIQALYRDHGLIAHYPFNGNANDESGNDNDGINNGAIPTTDRFDNDAKAYIFNGSSSYIKVAGSSSLNVTSGLTISSWVFLRSIGKDDQEIVAKWYNNDPGNEVSFVFEIGASTSKPRFVVAFSPSDKRITLSPTDIPLNMWVYLVATFDGTNSRIHINGLPVISNENIGTINVGTSPLMIGAHDGPADLNPFNGSLDDIRIYNRALSEQEIKLLYGNYRQQIISIKDIPNDQGGKVRINWDKIYLDSAGTTLQITSYGVWRKIPLGMSITKQMPSPMSIMNDTLGVLYDYLGTVNATQSPSYNFVAQTLQDSSESGTNAETFLITAHTSDPNVYYISEAASGYSVDNLAPSAPTTLAAVLQPDTSVQLTWSENVTDHDFQKYEVYRSTIENFIPNPSSLFATTIYNAYLDNSTIPGNHYYYVIRSVDFHGNQSDPSPQASAGMQTSQSYSVDNSWNMISVPLKVTDNAKTALYPTAISDAFTYDGTYISCTNLGNGKGYWLNFSGPQSVSISGYFVDVETVDVKTGWNMIGSISLSLEVSQIFSVPGGIITSEFFEYNGNYTSTGTIIPGKGYWVKVSEEGKLVMSTGAISRTSRIKVVPTNELPPQPPGERQSSTKEIPINYVIKQNYPNPFNPSTTIKYGLPQSAHVTLSVYNTLGQRVALLVDEKQETGYHEVTFSDKGGSASGGDGIELPSGVYFYRLQAGNFTSVQKMLLVK